jgi:hypothetical protein
MIKVYIYKKLTLKHNFRPYKNEVFSFYFGHIHVLMFE